MRSGGTGATAVIYLIVFKQNFSEVRLQITPFP